jgi:hypothetical protein
VRILDDAVDKMVEAHKRSRGCVTMKILESDDYETPVEEFPGYVGHTWDGEFFPGPELEALSSFDWDAYRELIDETNRPRPA